MANSVSRCIDEGRSLYRKEAMKLKDLRKEQKDIRDQISYHGDFSFLGHFAQRRFRF